MNQWVEQDGCPDWGALQRVRDEGPEGEASWMHALEHRSECATCHEAALAADPTLIFLDLPPVETSEAEIAAMQERVAISRRFSEVVTESESAEPRGRQTSRWLAAAAALAFVAVAGVNQPWKAAAPPEPAAVQAALPSIGMDETSPQSLADHLEALPLVEGGDVRYEVSGGSADYAVLVFTGIDL